MPDRYPTKVKWLPPKAGELKDTPAREFPEMVKGPLLSQPELIIRTPALLTPVLLETTKAPFEIITPCCTPIPVFVVEKWKAGRKYNITGKGSSCVVCNCYVSVGYPLSGFKEKNCGMDLDWWLRIHARGTFDYDKIGCAQFPSSDSWRRWSCCHAGRHFPPPTIRLERKLWEIEFQH